MNSMRSTSTTRRTIQLALAVCSVTLAAACGGSSSSNHATHAQPSTVVTSSSDASSGGPHNTADVTFATDMIPHHAQAVDMAAMALMKASDAEVKTLATAIKAAQAPEIAQMSGWLTAWRQPIPSTGAGHSMTGMAMTGMMTDAEMASLEKAAGAAFDKMWVEMMTRHHEGAVAMAKTELGSGQNVPAKALASQIISAQTVEIVKLKGISARLA
jgi:uncharacterized protein (DUF305 family)